MEITAKLISLIDRVIVLDEAGKPRQFAMNELVLASNIYREVKKLVGAKNVIKDGDMKLTSEEKVFITRLLDERKWNVTEAENVFELKELLK